MNLRSSLPGLPALLALALVLGPAPTATAGPVLLPDSTRAEAWTLANGLRVSARDVPGALGVVVTLAVPVGSEADPAETPGLARLAAEVQMMGAAGDVPERTREEMDSLRPLGWSSKVTRRATHLSEIASRGQFPGVLRQMALRLRGVTAAPEVVRAAEANVRRDLGQELFGAPGDALAAQVREDAAGADEATILALAAAKGLDKVQPADLEARLHREFVPAHAVLAIAGDLSGIDLHTLIEGEFGGIPPGEPQPSPPPGGLRPSKRVLTRSEVDHAVGVVGAFAPALTDTLHPYFFLSLLLIGQHCHQTWGGDGLLRTRFSYSILDDPEMVRFFPPVPAGTTDPQVLATTLEGALGQLTDMVISVKEYDFFRASVLWLLGGPLPGDVLAAARTKGEVLNTLCNGVASRELAGGEAFWAEYRRRFTDGLNPQLGRWANWVTRPEHQSSLLFTPRR